MSTSISTAAAIRAVLDNALASDPETVILGDAVGRAGGVAGTTAGLLDAHGPDRVLDLPIADRGTVALAVGIGMRGGRPVVQLADTSRIAAVLEVLVDAARIAATSDFACPLVVRVPYGTEAPGHDCPVGPWLARVPGLRVLCPSTPDAAAGLLRWALNAPTPTVILEPRRLYGQRGTVGEHAHPPAARIVRTGDHVTLAAWGTGVRAAEVAADALQAEGMRAGVIDLVSLAPLDTATLGARVRATSRLVVVHPDDPDLAAHVRQAALEEAFLYLEAPLGQATAAPQRVVAAARGAVTY